MDARSVGFSIGVLSRRTGCNVETIRYYERAGLLPVPPRSAGGYRQYGRAHLARLAFIRRARALGFSLDDVRRLLRLADERRRPCAEARALAAAHLADVRAKIADLRAMERVLRETVARCEAGTGSQCPVIDALSSESGPAVPLVRGGWGRPRDARAGADGGRAAPRTAGRPTRRSARRPMRTLTEGRLPASAHPGPGA